MSIAFLRDLKYLDTTVDVVSLCTGKVFTIEVLLGDDCIVLERSDIFCEIDEEKDQYYKVQDDDFSPYYKEALECSACDNIASKIYNCDIYCESCHQRLQFTRIKPNVYKFLSFDDQKAIMRAHGKKDHDFKPEIEKGLIVVQHDSDYDFDHLLIIDSNIIGEF